MKMYLSPIVPTVEEPEVIETIEEPVIEEVKEVVKPKKRKLKVRNPLKKKAKK